MDESVWDETTNVCDLIVQNLSSDSVAEIQNNIRTEMSATDDNNSWSMQVKPIEIRTRLLKYLYKHAWLIQSSTNSLDTMSRRTLLFNHLLFLYMLKEPRHAQPILPPAPPPTKEEKVVLDAPNISDERFSPLREWLVTDPVLPPPIPIPVKKTAASKKR